MQRTPILGVREISKSYGTHQVLASISLDFYAGEIVSLLGVNGAGKTTLSSIIAAIHPPTAGDVWYQQDSIYGNLAAYRKKVGYCAQKVAVQRGFTVYESLWYAGLAFGLTGDELVDRIEAVAKWCTMCDVLFRMPDELSGGYRQRFGLARTLLHNPDIVILDEPTVALDPHVRRQLWERILQMKAEGKTVILTTHYLDEAEHLSDRVCFLERGVIRYLDTPQALLKAFGKARLEEVMLSMME